MESTFELLSEYIIEWGYAAIFCGMALENANIPIPSELILGFAGYWVYKGHLAFWPVVIAGVIGGLLGSSASYWLGYYGGRPFVLQYGKYVFMSRSHLEAAERWFAHYGILAVFFARLLPFIRTFISLPAGFGKVNFHKFILYTVLGSLPWTIALVYAGTVLGENWHIITVIGHKTGLFVAGATVLIALYLYWRHRRQAK